MTFEERIERLTERQEALAHAVELLAGMQGDAEKRYEERFLRNEERLCRLMEAVSRLVDLVEAREHRPPQHN